MAELDLRQGLGEAFERLDQAGRLNRKSSPITRQDHQPYPTSPIGATITLSVVEAIHFPPLPERRPSKTWREYLRDCAIAGCAALGEHLLVTLKQTPGYGLQDEEGLASTYS